MATTRGVASVAQVLGLGSVASPKPKPKRLTQAESQLKERQAQEVARFRASTVYAFGDPDSARTLRLEPERYRLD